ncbi:MAG: hypothetical protein R2762_24790 [Bryobacteraceae bacterium]
MLREMVEERLQVHIATVEGGADACLFMGPKVTRELAANLVFGQNSYGFLLAPTPDNRLVVVEERVGFQRDSGPFGLRFGSGHQEAQLRQHCRNQPHGPYCEVYNAISSRVVYHFHDTSATAAVRRAHALNDNEYFRPEADNLAPFLYLIQRQNP